MFCWHNSLTHTQAILSFTGLNIRFTSHLGLMIHEWRRLPYSIEVSINTHMWVSRFIQLPLQQGQSIVLVRREHVQQKVCQFKYTLPVCALLCRLIQRGMRKDLKRRKVNECLLTRKANFSVKLFPGCLQLAEPLRIPAVESLLICHVLVDEKAIRIMGWIFLV